MNEFYNYLDKLDITPNAFHVLWCIANSRKPSLANPWPELRLLKLSELVDVNYVITDKGKEVLTEGQNILFSDSAPKSKAKVVVDNLEENAVKYSEIFPAGKLPSGKAARVNKKVLIDAFTWFFKNYSYDWSTILQATVYYVETYQKTDFKFMKNSQYFIRKQNIDKSWDSELADYCEIIKQGAQEDTRHFSENVV
jgi:hypothetical protein